MPGSPPIRVAEPATRPHPDRQHGDRDASDQDERRRRRSSWSARVAVAVLALAVPVLIVAGTSAAQEAPKPLPDPSAEPSAATLAPRSATLGPTATSSVAGTTNPVVDRFDRPDESPLSEEAGWSRTDPRGTFSDWCCFDLLSIFSEEAANFRGAGQSISYRPGVNYPGDMELFATVKAKPGVGRSLTLVFNIREIGPFSWDGFYLSWRDEAGTDC